MKKSKLSVGSSSPLILALFALSAGCGDAEKPPPGETTNPWHARTYLLDIGLVNWSEPRGIGGEIDEFVPSFLIHVQDEAPDAFSVMMGTANPDGAQDTCNKTGLLYATADSPSVTIGPAEFPLRISHTRDPIVVDGTAYDLTMTNVLPKGDDPIGEFTATLDFRQYYPLFTALPVLNPDTVCAAFEQSYQRPCAPCPHDGVPYCLTLKAIDLGATRVGREIETVESLHPSCPPATPSETP
jgi:hypothetical protein